MAALSISISSKQLILVVVLVAIFGLCLRETYKVPKQIDQRDFGNIQKIRQISHPRAGNSVDRLGVYEDDCQGKDTKPNGAFCMSKSKIYNYRMSFDSKLCAFIENLIQASSIVDLGAGLGYYGRCFLRQEFLINIVDKEKSNFLKEDYEINMKRANLFGTPQVITYYESYDGATNVESITYELVKPIDLAVPFDLGKKFDWVLTLEVGEHIAKSSEDIFLTNLINHACQGIILSWAVPGQPGLEHINNQPNSYIIEQMDARGFSYDAEATIDMRETVQVIFFKDTLMIFRRRDTVC